MLGSQLLSQGIGPSKLSKKRKKREGDTISRRATTSAAEIHTIISRILIHVRGPPRQMTRVRHAHCPCWNRIYHIIYLLTHAI